MNVIRKLNDLCEKIRAYSYTMFVPQIALHLVARGTLSTAEITELLGKPPTHYSDGNTQQSKIMRVKIKL